MERRGPWYSPGPQPSYEYNSPPSPPRSLVAQGASMEIRITWNAPVILRGVDGFRVYQDDENNMIFQTKDREARQYIATSVKASTTYAFYVSCVSNNGKESRKVQVMGTTNSDQLVVAGTTGATPGTSTAPPPNWTSEPSGGKQSKGGLGA